MRDGIEKLPDVQTQNPSIGSMLPPETLHVAGQAIHGECRSLALLTCAVVIYVVACQIFIQAKIAGGPLDDTVAELRRFDRPWLRRRDMEDGIRRQVIFACFQFVQQLDAIRRDVARVDP